MKEKYYNIDKYQLIVNSMEHSYFPFFRRLYVSLHEKKD